MSVAAIPRTARVDRLPRWAPESHGWARAAVTTVAVAAGAAYLLLALMRWRRMESPSWDLAIFTQAVRGYAEFGAPLIEVKGAGAHQLGDHFSPLLVVLVPAYWVAPSPVTLLVAQVFLLSVSVVPVGRAALRYAGTATGLALSAAYAFCWGFQSAVDVEFHEYALAVPLLAFGLVAMLDRRFVVATCWLAPVALVKEDLGVTVAVLGTIMAARGARAMGMALALYGCVCTVVAVLVILPAFSSDGSYGYWDEVGTGEADGLTTTPILQRMADALPHVLTPPVKLETLLLLFAVTGFAALRSTLTLAVLPTLLWRFTSGNPGYWQTTWHYSLILMPIVFVAAVEGVGRLRQSPSPRIGAAVRQLPGIVLTLAVVLCWRFPLGNLAQPQTYAPNSRAATAQAALAAIPVGATVETDVSLMSRLVTDRRVTWTGLATSGRAPDFVLVDEVAGGWSGPIDAVTWARSTHPDVIYVTVIDRQGISLARRTSP